MVVSGKSGFVAACYNFVTGPNSDHSIGGFVACPLNRLKVVIPMCGLSSKSLTGTGRTMTVSRWAYEKELRITSMATRKLFIDSPRQIQATTPEQKITKMTARVANLLSVCATSCCFYIIFAGIRCLFDRKQLRTI